MDDIIVEIIVEGGVIQDINLPKNVTAIVKDYDIDGYEIKHLKQDTDGDYYNESVWTN